MSYDEMKQQHDEMMTRIRAELYGNDPREAVIAELRAQLATANEARQQLQEALSVRNTQLATVTQRAEAAEAKLNDVLPGYVAQCAKLLEDNTDQAWEIAKLRHYVEALERRLDYQTRQQAVEAASVALAKHNPPQWIWDRDAQAKALQARILSLEVGRSKTVKLRDDTDSIIWSLKPNDVPGAINWGDLGVREVQHVTDDDRQWYRVIIEEADPGNPALHAAVLAGLAALGWQADDLEIETAW